MSLPMTRRHFLTMAGVATATMLALPRSNAVAQSDRLVVAVGRWGTETPFAWRTSQAEKTLWDCIHDPLIMRDPKTFQYLPGLATAWKPSDDAKTWTFTLRQGVMFHENWGEFTGEDVKFTIEQNLKPDSQGGSAPFFRTQLERIELPEKYTVVMHFKTPVWEVPSHVSQFVGYQNMTSKKYLESVGEDKAAQHPIGTGPFQHVEGKQGDFHRFQAVPKHWRQTPGFKELIIRRLPEPATRLSGIRAGEIDLGQVFGDYLAQARKVNLRIHEAPNAALYWVVMGGQTTPDRPDYCPQCPWAGDVNDPQSLEKARKVRLAMNLAVNKKAIIDGLWKGTGSATSFSYWYYPFNQGYSAAWEVPPFDLPRAKKLLDEAGVGGGFELTVNPMVSAYALDGPDVMEAVALDWEKLGLKVKRVPDAPGNFGPKVRARKTGPVSWVYGSPPFDEPGLAWQRTIWSKGAFNILAEGPYDQEVNAILGELDAAKRTTMTQTLGQRLYEQYHGVMLGMKSTTWALSKKVGTWTNLAVVPLENNYEYITPA